jgi:hypothetical protein
MGDTALSRSQCRPGSAKWPSEYPLHLVAWQEKLAAQQLLEHDANYPSENIKLTGYHSAVLSVSRHHTALVGAWSGYRCTGR